MDPSKQNSSQVKTQDKIREIPVYAQHTNACGLASLLMLIDIPNNPKIQHFLEAVWNHIKPLYEQPVIKKPELKWAIVLQYVLLKILGYADKEDLYEFFNQRLEFMYEDQRIMNKFNQEQYYNDLLRKKKYLEAYTYLHYTEDHDYVLPLILFKNLHTMKTDLELKVLAEFFNYQFMYQEAEDYTGAIYFTNQELGREISQSARVKWNKLEKFAQEPNTIILYGQQHHWLAVRGVYKIKAKDDIPEEVVEVIKERDREKAREKAKEKASEKVKEKAKEKAKEKSKEKEKRISKEIQNEKNQGNSNNQSESTYSDSSESSNSLKKRGKNKINSVLAEISAIFEDEFSTWHPRRLIVDMNDPALVARVQFPYRSLNESDRFYIFRKRPINDYPAFDLILKYLKDDCLAEQVRWKDYLEKRAKSMEHKPTAEKENIKKTTENGKPKRKEA